MTKTIIISIILLGSLSAKIDCQDTDIQQFRFYDFNVIIDLRNGLLANDSKYILCNLDTYSDCDNASKSRMDNNTFYLIKYEYSVDMDSLNNVSAIRLPIDTLTININSENLDSLFQLTSNLFDLKGSENLSQYKIPPPPVINDGDVAEIIFDLGFRGDRYMIDLSWPEGNDSYLKLKKYIDRLFINAQ